jgi:hypothetical protein
LPNLIAFGRGGWQPAKNFLGSSPEETKQKLQRGMQVE